MRIQSPTIREIFEEGYEYLQGLCLERSMWRTMGLDRLRLTPGQIDLEKLTLAQLVERLRCHKCGAAMQEVWPWRQSDVTGDTKAKWGPKRRPPTDAGLRG